MYSSFNIYIYIYQRFASKLRSCHSIPHILYLSPVTVAQSSEYLASFELCTRAGFQHQLIYDPERSLEGRCVLIQRIIQRWSCCPNHSVAGTPLSATAAILSGFVVNLRNSTIGIAVRSC